VVGLLGLEPRTRCYDVTGYNCAAGSDLDPGREEAALFEFEEVLSAVGDFWLKLRPIE
jgi:hypothetical protein